MQVSRRDGESFEQLWRRFKVGMERSGILGDAKRKRYYLSKGEARRVKAQRAARRLLRRQRRKPIGGSRGRAAGG
jgi:ribosomal protein S21